jgi:dUTPase
MSQTNNPTSIGNFLINFRVKTSHKNVMQINIFVDSNDTELKQRYIDAAHKHNSKLLDDPHFYDAGFDIFLPKTNETNVVSFNSTIPPKPNKVDFKIKCCAKIHNIIDSSYYFSPFYTYARSSISKTPLRLANNQGIIDAGYRGNIIGMFDYNITNPSIITPSCKVIDGTELNDIALPPPPPPESWTTEVYSRLLQICAPNLMPIFVNIVDNIEHLGPSTSRGEGGIGSTGK